MPIRRSIKISGYKLISKCLDSGYGVIAAINRVDVGGTIWTVILAHDGFLSFVKFITTDDLDGRSGTIIARVFR